LRESYHLFFLLLFSTSLPPPPRSPLFPYTTLFRSHHGVPPPRVSSGRRDGRPRRRRAARNARGRRGQGVRAMDGDARRNRVRRSDRKSTRLNSSHVSISYAVFCLKKKKKRDTLTTT